MVNTVKTGEVTLFLVVLITNQSVKKLAFFSTCLFTEKFLKYEYKLLKSQQKSVFHGIMCIYAVFLNFPSLLKKTP